jgi:hypothetical protein
MPPPPPRTLPTAQRKAQTRAVIASIETIDTAAPSGALLALPNSDWMTLPIMMPEVPPTSVGVT